MYRMKFAISNKSDSVLVFGVIGILMLMFTPIPPELLDFLLITNFCFALLILLLTFYTDKPLSFSTFPSLLLIATLFRLGLNITATRLILSHGDAGNVIGTIGNQVVGGNYVVGMVVFLILVVVQFVVVTAGAQRVAEVAARFTLDSMPGKQMSIDADLNMGIIDEHEAKERRKTIEKEANFYGAMDGATKFVKGDAIAGIIITLIDIIGGLSIGIAQMGMSWGESLQTFTLLTIGDGIVTQIPSLVIATATGIIITRAASDAQLGTEVAKQISSYPKILFIIAGALGLTLLVPGISSTPVLILLFVFLTTGIVCYRNQRKAEEKGNNVKKDSESPTDESIDDLYQMISIVSIELKLGNKVALFVEENGASFLERIANFRKQYAMDYGMVLPELVITDDSKLKSNQYQLIILGGKVASGEIEVDQFMAIDPGGERSPLSGSKTKEPTYGLPAYWIDEDKKEFARTAGYTGVDPETLLLTHTTELIKKSASELLSRAETEKLVSRLQKSHGNLIEELIPTVLSFSDIQKVLQLLIQEKVSIRSMELILEVLVDQGKVSKEAEFLADKVRARLRTQICQQVSSDESELNVLTIESSLEQRLIRGIQTNNGTTTMMLEPGVTEPLLKNLATATESMLTKKLTPVLICSPMLRRQLKHISERVVPHLHVLSFNEIPPTTNVKAFSMIRLSEEMEKIA